MPEISGSFQVDATARFRRPGDLAVDNSGKLYVMDRGNQSIRLVATNGEVSTLPGIYDANTRITLDAAGTPVILSGTDIFRLSSTGVRTPVKSYPVQSSSYTPLSIAADAQDRIYVLIGYRNIFRIERINADASSNYVYYINNYGYNVNLASDALGNLAVGIVPPTFSMSDKLGTAIEYIPLAVQTSESVHAPGITFWPVDYSYLTNVTGSMAFDAQGNLYVAGTSYTFNDIDGYQIDALRILKITPAGFATEIYRGLPGETAFSYSQSSLDQTSLGLAVSRSGIVYFSDPFSHSIYRLDISGNAVLVAGQSGFAGSSD